MIATKVYGLREALRIVAAVRAEMAADPATVRSQDSFVRGERAMLAEINAQIARRIKELAPREKSEDGT